MNHDKLSYIRLIIFLSLLHSGSLWAYYEKGYRGNNDAVCYYNENNERNCPDLGEHAYRGQLVEGIPKSHAYFMNDAELYEEETPIVYKDKMDLNYYQLTFSE